jgi:precorrin-6A synthase
MINLVLIGIGTGDGPADLGRRAGDQWRRSDPDPAKGADKADLADLRRAICEEVLTNPATRIASFDLPVRDPATPDYLRRVDDWHDAIAAVWARTIADHPGRDAWRCWSGATRRFTTVPCALPGALPMCGWRWCRGSCRSMC